MRVFAGIFGTVLLFALMTTSPHAMQLMMVVEEQSADGKTTGSHTIYAAKDIGIHVGFKYGDDHGGIVWNKELAIAWMMDFIEGTYWTMTEEDAAKIEHMRQEMAPMMKEQQEKMKALFDEQMKHMTEEEKKAAMQHLPMGMGMEEEEEIVYEEAGTKSLDPWGNTAVYIGRQYGEMVEKVFTVGWDQLGVDESYLKVFGEFGEFAGGFMEGEEGDQPFKFAQLEEEQGYPGFAVKKELYDDYGELESIEIVKAVETQETDPDKYQLPADPPLKETDSPFDDMPTDMPGMPGF
jgi:hypothetical protein